MTNFISYAQNFEDIMLWRALKDIENGFYIDVGANDPKVHSVTKAFYDRGWRGINIEPAEAFFRRLEEERPGDVNLRMVAAAGPGIATFYDIPDTGLSTTERDIADGHRRTGHEVIETQVESATLASICREHVKGDVHFLKIDVEGGTLGVIQGLDLDQIRPWIILVEATRPMTQIEDYMAWEPLLTSKRYECVYHDGLNRFYVAQDRADIAGSFNAPPNVFDEFVLASTEEASMRAQQSEARADEAERERATACASLTEQLGRASEAERRAHQAEQQNEELQQAFVGQVARVRAAEERAHQSERDRTDLLDTIAGQVARVRAAEERAHQSERDRTELLGAFAGQVARVRAAEERAHQSERDRTELLGAFAGQDVRARAAEERAHHSERDRTELLARLAREAELNATISARLGEREDLMRRVFESRSWRLAAPLRALGVALRGRRPDILPATAATRRPRPTIFIECTHTYHSDLNTGIQRVVRNILRNAPAVARDYGYDVVPVIVEGDRFHCVAADRVLANKQSAAHTSAAAAGPAATPPATFRQRTRQALRRPWRAMLRALETALPFPRVRAFLYAPPHRRGLARSVLLLAGPLGRRGRARTAAPPGMPRGLDDFDRCDGSILLLLDSSWASPVWPGTRRFKERGGIVVGVVYDLIPITHSHTCVPELTTAFKAWIAEHLRWSDGFVCISRSVADTLADYVRGLGAAGSPPSQARIDYFHLGSELDFIEPNDPVRQSIQDNFDADRHAFLMVGTIEPRKMHAFALDAFDRFWERGGNAALVIVGRYTWKMEAFLERVARHPELGRRLFILRDATDAELDHCYRNASSLVIASEVEGFGLPVVEAFQRGLPVMCSDIPVFREIADGRATFFSLSDPMHLTGALEGFCRNVPSSARRERTPQAWIGWRQSTEQLLAAAMRLRQHPRVRLPATV